MFAMSREKAFKFVAKYAGLALSGVGAVGLTYGLGTAATDAVAQSFDIHNIVTEFARSAVNSGWPGGIGITPSSGLLFTTGLAVHLRKHILRTHSYGPLQFAGLARLES